VQVLPKSALRSSDLERENQDMADNFETDEEHLLLLEVLGFPHVNKSQKTGPEISSKVGAAAGFVSGVSFFGLLEGMPRGDYKKRDRLSVKAKILSMSPALFKRNYRLQRKDFFDLLSKIRPIIAAKQSGNAMHVCGDDCEWHIDPFLQLALTLRMLAGGSYLDICFGYEVSTGSLYATFWKVLQAIDAVLDNINFDFENEAVLEFLESTFVKISKGVFRGTVAAGDGIIFRRMKPDRNDVDGDVCSFFTRKGFWGHAVQAFCDGNCKFVHVSQKVCASSHDGTAYWHK